jgi:hypothetical protein
MYLGITGGYILTLDGITYSTPTYDLMAGLLSLDTYGVIMLVVSALYLYGTVQEGLARGYALLIGGTIGALLIGLYAMAAFEGSDNALLPLRYAVFAGFNLIIAGVGGFAIWIRRG